jgi:UDP:flavonoid glycosyltransferase YjiC (YdhE family)
MKNISAGIPQVVLPVWMDTFDFARRGELLGIGRWGNKMSQATKGSWGGELGNVLTEVLLKPQATQMKEKARDLAELCNQNGGGRVVAARMILKEIREPVFQSKEGAMLRRNGGLD